MGRCHRARASPRRRSRCNAIRHPSAPASASVRWGGLAGHVPTAAIRSGIITSRGRFRDRYILLSRLFSAVSSLVTLSRSLAVIHRRKLSRPPPFCWATASTAFAFEE